MDLLIPEVTIEECAEVIQAISKYIRFGPYKNGYDNKVNLETEIGQLKFMLQELEIDMDLDSDIITDAYNKKGKALIHYATFNTCNEEPAGA
jgi:NTP pyrophosphatase (non-canonical NTP hydrolase)